MWFFNVYSRYDLPWWLPIAYFLISAYVAAVVTRYLFGDVSWLDFLTADKYDQRQRPMVVSFLIILAVIHFVLWQCTVSFLEYFQLAIRT